MGYLVEKEQMDSLDLLHAFLQKSRMEIKFEGFFPGSIFVFELSQIPDFPPFDYSDNPVGRASSKLVISPISASNLAAVSSPIPGMVSKR